MIAVVDGLVKLKEFKIHDKGRLSTLNFSIGTSEYRFVSVYAPSEKETEGSISYFKKLFQTEIIDPERQNIVAGYWNCGVYSKDYHNYVDWINYRPKTRQIIKNGSLEHGLVDPYVISNPRYAVRSQNIQGTPTVEENRT